MSRLGFFGRAEPPLRLRAGAVLFGAAVLAAACGIPVSDAVEVIPEEDHIELLDGTTTTTIEETDPEEEGVARVGLYFVGPDDKIERIIRAFPAGTTRDEVLAALEQGPLPTEVEESGFEILQTQLPVGLTASFGVQDEERSSQTVDVNPEAQLRETVEEQPVLGRLIVTQIVCTALGLDLDGPTGIIIEDGGEDPIPLSDINAEILIGPATKADFDDCKTGEQERLEAEEAEAEAEAEEGDTDATTSTTAAGG